MTEFILWIFICISIGFHIKDINNVWNSENSIFGKIIITIVIIIIGIIFIFALPLQFGEALRTLHDIEKKKQNGKDI